MLDINFLSEKPEMLNRIEYYDEVKHQIPRFYTTNIRTVWKLSFASSSCAEALPRLPTR